MDALVGLLERVEQRWPQFYNRLLFVEQPLDRALALDPQLAPAIAAVSAKKPMLIDESDEDLDTFKKATALGYRGVSSKACKGLIKALANAALARHLDGERYFVSGEDLTNIAVVPLHQDLAHLAALGLRHAERNGHHYVRGLDHLSERERQICLSEHADLYGREQGLAALRIVGGQIEIGSLQRPGLGVGAAVDTEALTPVEEWSVDELVEEI